LFPHTDQLIAKLRMNRSLCAEMVRICRIAKRTMTVLGGRFDKKILARYETKLQSLNSTAPQQQRARRRDRNARVDTPLLDPFQASRHHPNEDAHLGRDMDGDMDPTGSLPGPFLPFDGQEET